MSDTKICSKCGETKPLEKFSRGKGGRKSKCKACDAAYYASRRQHALDKQREYRDENRERINARHRAYHQTNREERNARRSENHRENAERDRRRSLAWLEANRESAIESSWRDSYRTRARGFDFPLVEERVYRADVVERYGDSCFYCKTQPFEQIDHYVPISKGGPHTLNNLRPSCAACNLTKRSTPGDKWMAAS